MRSSGVLAMLAVLSVLSTSTHGLLINLDNITISSLGNIQSGNANADIDFLLQNFQGSLPGRLNLENIDNKYAHNCFLTGLNSGIKRHGDAILDVTNTTATFMFGLSSNRITVQCSWSKRIAFKKFRGTVSAYTDRVSVRARLRLALVAGASPSLQEFKVTELSKIRTHFSGAGFLNWIAEKFLNRKVNGARDKIIREFESKVSARLQNKLNTLKLPTV